MINLYKYFDNPDELEQREYAPIKFDYDILESYINKLERLFNNGDFPEKYQLIERVFGRPEKYYTHISTYGQECVLCPLGINKRASYSINLQIEDNNIIGYYTHYTEQTQFYKGRSKIDQEKQMDEILTLGLTKLAEAELND